VNDAADVWSDARPSSVGIEFGKSATARLDALIDNLETVVDAAALSRATRLGSARAAPSKATEKRAVKKRRPRKSSR